MEKKIIQKKNYWHTFSSWFLVCLVFLIIFATNDYVMFFGGAFFSGVFFTLLMIAVFFEAYVNRLPKILMIIPILYVLGYYVVYFNHKLDISTREAELKALNPMLAMQYNSEEHSLVLKGAQVFVRLHHIPIAYEADSKIPEGYSSFRILSLEQCQQIDRKRLNPAKGITVYRKKYPRDALSALCTLQFPENPHQIEIRKVLNVDLKENEVWAGNSTIREDIYTFSLNGQFIDEYRTADTYLYPPFPFLFIGCNMGFSLRFAGRYSGYCGVEFAKTTKYELNVTSEELEKNKVLNPVANMLGINQYSDQETSNFAGYQSNDEVLLRVQKNYIDLRENVIERLDQVIDIPTHGDLRFFLQTVTSRTDILAEQAERIVEFLEKREIKNIGVDLKRKYLMESLAWLPDQELQIFGSRIVELIKAYEKPIDIISIYIRAADSGAEIENFYLSELRNNYYRKRVFYMPISGLCRLDNISDETLGWLKEAFNQFNPLRQKAPNQEALFLALLKHGERDFLMSKLQEHELRNENWYQQILRRKDNAGFGPNNCMPDELVWNYAIPQELERLTR